MGCLVCQCIQCVTVIYISGLSLHKLQVLSLTIFKNNDIYFINVFDHYVQLQFVLNVFTINISRSVFFVMYLIWEPEPDLYNGQWNQCVSKYKRLENQCFIHDTKYLKHELWLNNTIKTLTNLSWHSFFFLIYAIHNKNINFLQMTIRGYLGQRSEPFLLFRQ